MTLIKKQCKDNGELGSSKKAEQEQPMKTKKTAGPCDKDSEAKTENEAGSDAGVGNAKNENGGADTREDGKDQPSEADVLKFYLKQALENSKKQKEESESLKSQVEQLNSQLVQCKEKFDGIVAEYDNYRRRTTAEKQNLGTEATSKAVKALLPALDNLERAVPFAESNPESFKTGVEMTLKQLSDAFKSLGVEEIEARGAVFDPELHDAVMHADDDSLGESIITEVFQKGYRIGDKVVRHSTVKVVN
jgi:molecular chaperone GrpE